MQSRLSAANLVASLNQLPKNRAYNYLNPKTKGLIKIEEVNLPEGPIKIKRWNPSKKGTEKTGKVTSISTEMLWRIANACTPDYPINFDRVLGASYNTRSALETLLAHTSNFFFCYPGRVEVKNMTSKIKRGHKHLMWIPSETHTVGTTEKKETEIVISEVPSLEAVYEAIVLPTPSSSHETLSIDIQRRHAQIQVALYFIGKQLNYRTWIAQNDKGIVYQDKRLAEYDDIVPSLQDEKLIGPFDNAVRAALLIDCIWFHNSKLMPAVMEIEHSTGVTSGLTRMKNLYDHLPRYAGTRFVVVGDESIRAKVIQEANKPQFRELNTMFFPYASVEELFALCQKRKLKGVTEAFLDCYMEPVLLN